MKLTKCLQDGDAVRGGVHGIQTGGRLCHSTADGDRTGTPLRHIIIHTMSHHHTCHSTADGDRTGTPTPIVHLMMISITEINK